MAVRVMCLFLKVSCVSLECAIVAFLCHAHLLFDHMNCTVPGNLFSILNIMLKYQYVTKVALNFKEAL